MSGYTKLFGSILESTVWLESPPVKVVWITMLAMADRDGVVEASVPGLAKRAGVDRVYCEQALATFTAPDPDSRTRNYEGRRIVEVPGGWRLLNYELHRHRASKEQAIEKAADRQRRHRERKAQALRHASHALQGVTNNESNPIAPSPASSVQDVSVSTESSRSVSVPLDHFEAFWDAYPRKVGKVAAKREWVKLKPTTALGADIVASVHRQRGSLEWLKDGGQFIPHPRTWLHQGRWMDEPIGLPQVSEQTARTLTAAEAFVRGDGHDDP